MASVLPSGVQAYSGHSNTAIYPPFLYVVPAAATAVGRALDLPVLWWLYLGRLANALVGGLILLACFARSRDAGLILLVAAMLPLTLFQMSTVSADALLFPLTFAFAVLLNRYWILP